MKKFTFILTLLVLSFTTFLKADEPALKVAIKITSMQIIGNPLKGNDVQLRVGYISNIDGEAEVTLTFPKYVVLKNRKLNYIKDSKLITLKKGIEQQITYNLAVEESGESFLSVAFILKNPPQGYNRNYYKYINIENTRQTYSIFDESDSTNKKIKEIQTRRGNNSLNKTSNTLTSQNYAVSISGKVQYDDVDQGATKGLYENSVELWFRNSSNQNNWYHPVYSTDCTGTRHVHYDVVDVNGNYSFNFSFNGDLSAYNQILIIVSRSNDATYMPLQNDGIRTWCNNSYTDFFSLAEGVVQNFNGSAANISLTNVNALVNSGDGAIFRNMKLSKEFVVQRYGGTLPFSLPSVYTIRKTLTGMAGVFYPNDAHIEIDNNYTELSTTSHEFGHYVNYKIWNDYLISDDGCSNELGQTVPGTGKIYKEGWAIFYSFVVRNYANKVYGDYIHDWEDNTEVAPFESPRFFDIRYTSVDPNISAFACYLWNLYDGYNDGNFKASTYSGDNDDINGLSMQVFETMRNPIKDCVSKYDTQFKNNLSVDQQNSVNDIYIFMFQNSGHYMRSAQIGNATASLISGTQINFQWTSDSYSNIYFYYNYGNYETGYRIYKNINNSWQIIQTINYGTNNFNYTSSNAYGQYKVTAYNSTGDSYNYAYFNFVQFTASISGPSYLNSGQNGTWTASVSGGYSPYHYQWYYEFPAYAPAATSPNLPPRGYWFPLGTDSPTLTTSFSKDVELKCQVTDFHSNVITSNILYVSIGLAKQSISQSDVTKVPTQFSVAQNYPNPFNPSTKINYALPSDANVIIKVYDMLGREVRDLENEHKVAGFYTIDFNASTLSSGIYFYRITARNQNDILFSDSKRMILLK